MNRFIVLSLLLPAAAVAQTDTLRPRPHPDQVSARIRFELERRGVNLDEVLKTARQRQEARLHGKVDTLPKVPEQAQPLSDGKASTSLNSQIGPLFQKLYSSYEELEVLDSPPRLVIDSAPTINAYASKGREVRVFLALAELVNDSPSELAFVIAHELGHIVQQRTGMLLFVEDNAEFDADVWGVLVAWVSGYDPYAGAGTLAKLSMVVGDVGLSRQFEDQSGDDAHKSFVTRIEVMYEALQAVCGINESFQQACSDYREAAHPHFPGKAVL